MIKLSDVDAELGPVSSVWLLLDLLLLGWIEEDLRE
jgi:hypothetical protein